MFKKGIKYLKYIDVCQIRTSRWFPRMLTGVFFGRCVMSVNYVLVEEGKNTWFDNHDQLIDFLVDQLQVKVLWIRKDQVHRIGSWNHEDSSGLEDLFRDPAYD